MKILVARKTYFRELRQYHKEFLKFCREENKIREMQKKINVSSKLKNLESCKGGNLHGYP